MMMKKPFILLLAALALCAGAVVGQQQPDKEKWVGKLADGTVIDEKWMVQFVIKHRHAVKQHEAANGFDKGKVEDYPQPLKGARLSGIDLTLIVAKAVESESLVPLDNNYLGYLDLSGCRLDAATLEGLQLEGVSLNGADISEANLSRVVMVDVNLSDADFTEANLKEAHFENVDATGTTFSGGTLNSAKFIQSRMDRSRFFNVHAENLVFDQGSAVGALFSEANLRGAQFFDTNVEGAIFFDADLFEATWESHGKPDLALLARTQHLETLTFDRSEIGLVELRKAFMEAGMRGTERKINYALQRARTESLRLYGWDKQGAGPMDQAEAKFRDICFDWTCLYGLDPGRPLRFIAYLCAICAVFYAGAIFRKPRCIEKAADWKVNAPPDTTQSGIWAVPLEKRVASGSSDPMLVHVDFKKDGWLKSLWRALGTGLFFSVISAFSTGYRDLDVGRWIERIKREESTLRGTGWVRTISGIQSLLSFYLLALWLLTYFGRPFE